MPKRRRLAALVPDGQAYDVQADAQQHSPAIDDHEVSEDSADAAAFDLEQSAADAADAEHSALLRELRELHDVAGIRT